MKNKKRIAKLMAIRWSLEKDLTSKERVRNSAELFPLKKKPSKSKILKVL